MPKNNMGATPGKFKAFAMVRGADGKPKIDDPATMPEQLQAMLTDDEYLDVYKKDKPQHIKDLKRK